MKYTYEIQGDLAEHQQTTTVTANRVPSFELWQHNESVLRNRFKRYNVERIQHSASGKGIVVINRK